MVMLHVDDTNQQCMQVLIIIQLCSKSWIILSIAICDNNIGYHYLFFYLWDNYYHTRIIRNIRFEYFSHSECGLLYTYITSTTVIEPVTININGDTTTCMGNEPDPCEVECKIPMNHHASSIALIKYFMTSDGLHTRGSISPPPNGLIFPYSRL